MPARRTLKRRGQAGVWTLAGDRADHSRRVTDPQPCWCRPRQVRLLAVDLPLANRAKRLAALPFAIEDQIAEPIESVHLALGAEIAPKRYLVGVVRHDGWRDWVAIAEDAGLDHAALVPDALALPRAGGGRVGGRAGGTRAVVRAGDGTGFAMPAADAARRVGGRRDAHRDRLWRAAARRDDGRGRRSRSIRSAPPARRALDLRQGIYARRRRPSTGVARGSRWIVALGAAAHTGSPPPIR